jgi:hypothetical protein
MTTEQLLILGTIYIAPHMHPIYCHVMGSIFMFGAVCKALGWL